MKNALPSLYLSHGSPMLALEPGRTGPFLQQLGTTIDAAFGRPASILMISAHSTARQPVLLAGAQHHAVYDFGGFPDALYQLQYNPPGDVPLAKQVHALLAEAGLPVHSINEGGLDHGIWSMLRFMYPQADIPVLPLAWVPNLPPEQQFALGQVLSSLSEQGVLIVGSGSITHNLRRLSGGGRQNTSTEEIIESATFRQWMQEHSAQLDWDGLFAYRSTAPYARDMHPTDEHLLPWFVAAGAGGREAAPQRIHADVTFGSLGMDAYAFGSQAQALVEALKKAPH